MMRNHLKSATILLLSVASILLTVSAFSGGAQAAGPEPSTSKAADVAPEQGDCSTPRRAVRSLVYWTDSSHLNPKRAAECVDRSGRSPKELEQAVLNIRSAYDSHALRIDLSSLSDNPDWVQASTHKPLFAPHVRLPGIQVRKDNGRWAFTRASIDHAEYLAHSAALIPAAYLGRLPDWLRTDVFGVEGWQVLSLLSVFVLGALIRKIIQFILLRRLAPLAAEFGASTVGHITDVFAGPGSTIVVAGLLAVFYPTLGLPYGAASALGILVRALVVFSLGHLFYRLVDVLADRLAQKAESTDSKLDDQLVPLIRKALKIVVVICGVLFLLQNLNVDVGSLLAGLGIGGVAIALAAKDTIANFFGSLMIFIDRPFQIGDWVKIGDTEGVIEEVGFRSTRVRTFYNSLVTVPNAQFTEAAIDNLGMREFRRTFVTLNLTYDTTPAQMEAFVEGVRAVICSNPYSRKDYYEVHFSGFGAHSLDVMVYFFFKVSSWTEELRERHNVFLEILRLAKQLGVEFAFPTQTLHVDALAAPGAARRVPEPQTEADLASIVTGFGPAGTLKTPHTPYLSSGFVADTGQKGGDAG